LNGISLLDQNVSAEIKSPDLSGVYAGVETSWEARDKATGSRTPWDIYLTGFQSSLPIINHQLLFFILLFQHLQDLLQNHGF
jgi:hypothetical protein